MPTLQPLAEVMSKFHSPSNMQVLGEGNVLQEQEHIPPTILSDEPLSGVSPNLSTTISIESEKYGQDKTVLELESEDSNKIPQKE